MDTIISKLVRSTIPMDQVEEIIEEIVDLKVEAYTGELIQALRNHAIKEVYDGFGFEYFQCNECHSKWGGRLFQKQEIHLDSCIIGKYMIKPLEIITEIK